MQVLQKKGHLQLMSHQLIASKMPVGLDTPPQVLFREDRKTKTTESWNNWAQSRELEEWLAAVGGVMDVSYTGQCVLSLSKRV
jgi:actin-like protein 6B